MVREAVQRGRVLWRQHALLRARRRGIARDLALRAIHQGECLEEYPAAEPFPRYLFMLDTARGPLYVVASYDYAQDQAYVITVRWMDPRKWSDPWTRRREVY